MAIEMPRLDDDVFSSSRDQITHHHPFLETQIINPEQCECWRRCLSIVVDRKVVQSQIGEVGGRAWRVTAKDSDSSWFSVIESRRHFQ